MTTAVSHRWRWGVLAAATLSCSLLIEGEAEPLRCSREGQVGPPACDPGQSCHNGVCGVLAGVGGAGEAGGAGGAGD